MRAQHGNCRERNWQSTSRLTLRNLPTGRNGSQGRDYTLRRAPEVGEVLRLQRGKPKNRGESILAEASYAACSVFRKSKLGSSLRRSFCGERSRPPIGIQLIPSPELCAQSSRRATATGLIAARIAGSSPPSTPITSANNTPIRRRSKVILNAKARLEKVCQFMVLVVKPLSGRTARQPIKPAANDINRA